MKIPSDVRAWVSGLLDMPSDVLHPDLTDMQFKAAAEYAAQDLRKKLEDSNMSPKPSASKVRQAAGVSDSADPNDHVSASKHFLAASTDRQKLHFEALKYAEKYKVSYTDAVVAVTEHNMAQTRK